MERYDYKAPEMDADPVVRASTQELSEAGDGLLATLTERGIVRDGLIRDDVRAADLIDALTTPPHIEDAGTDGFSHDHIMLADVTVLPDGSVGG